MKKIIFLILIGFSAQAQSVTNLSSRAKFPYNITPYSIIDQKNGDTLCWYWNRAEVIAYVASNPTSGITTAQADSVARSVLPIFGNYIGLGNGVQDTFQITIPTGYTYSLCNFKSGATASVDSLATYGCSISGTKLILTFYDHPNLSIPPLGAFSIDYILSK